MSVAFKSINPKNGKIYRTFEAISAKELETKIDFSYQRFRKQYQEGPAGLETRFDKMRKLAKIFEQNKAKYAETIT
jgi:acyl-CoA reductase-like NAD-dependent aldehyde dehydrogenase